MAIFYFARRAPNYKLRYYGDVIHHSIGNQTPGVRKRNFPCNDDNVAFMQQVHSKTTGKQSVLLKV